MRVRLNRLNQIIDRNRWVDGYWKLSKDHELQYRRRGPEEEVILSGQIVGTEPNGLVFRVDETRLEGDTASRQMTLRGKWEADSRNRLRFVLDGQQGLHRRLTFQGAWEVNEQHELLYQLQREREGKRERTIHLLRFEGHWDVGDDRRLTYLLDADSDSAFRFRGAFQTPVLLPKAEQIRYQVGIELEGKRRVLRTITLFGKWKFSKALELSFEVPYRHGLHALDFSAIFHVRPDGEIAARLLTREGRPLGVEVIFTQQFLKKQAEAFVRLRKLAEETAVEGGVRLRW